MKFQATFYAVAALVATTSTLALNITNIQQDMQAMITQTNVFRAGIAKFSSGGSATLASVLLFLSGYAVKLANKCLTDPPH